MEITASETIALPVQRVFERITDISSWPDVAESIVGVEVLTEGPVGVGTRFRETRVMFGKEASEEMEVTAFEPPRSWTHEARSHGMHYVTTTTFEPTNDGGTEICMRFAGTPTSLGGKIMGVLMGALMKGQCLKATKKDLADMKAAYEAEESAA